jgi:general secretion pathway protein H
MTAPPTTARSTRPGPTNASGAVARAASRAREGGLTLIEIIVVISLFALVTSVAVMGSNQLPSARLRRSATMIASAVKVAFTRSTAISRDLRLVMDIDQSKIWLEEGDRPMLVQSKDDAKTSSTTGGAEAVTEAEKAARAETDQIMKGPVIPRPSFHAISTYGFGESEEKTIKKKKADDGTEDPDAPPPVEAPDQKALQRGIKFRQVQVAHDDSPVTSGRAYLYFWPGGTTERASIQLRIGDSEEDYQTLTLIVSPLTGKVTVKAGPVDLTLPTDDETASERKENTL